MGFDGSRATAPRSIANEKAFCAPNYGFGKLRWLIEVEFRGLKPDALLIDLCDAVVQRYNNRTDKRARYRPKNPHIKPLGDPTIRKLSPEEKKKLRSHELKNAA